MTKHSHRISQASRRQRTSPAKINFESWQMQVVQDVCFLLGCESGALTLLDTSDDRYLIRKTFTPQGEWHQSVIIRDGRGLVRECLSTRTPILANAATSDAKFDESVDALEGVMPTTILCAPMMVDDKILGVLHVLNKREGNFDAQDLHLLVTLAKLTAVALYHFQMSQELMTANAELCARKTELLDEKLHLENILAQSEKLAAIGQLAAGVAHEINNPLTAILANAQILHRELPPDHDLQESVDLISRAGARAAQVVRNLLDFARQEDFHFGITDLNETVRRALELVRHEILARSARLESHLDPSIPPVLANQDHLQSVWLNLLLNAIDSLDKIPGEVKVTSQRMENEIQVSVRDNGKGIPAENLSRIFEPFYTTKAPGRGTGLRLTVSHRIVRQHGGHIRVESQVGAGSIFTVILPMAG